MASGALRAAWEAAQQPTPQPPQQPITPPATQQAPGSSLRAAWEAAQGDVANGVQGGSSTTAPSVGQKRHDDYKSGALAKRMASENAADAASAQPGMIEKGVTHVLNAAQGIPGVRAVEAAGGVVGSHIKWAFSDPITHKVPPPLEYQQSLKTLDDATGQIGGKTRFAEKMVGGLATLPFLPASAVKAGAMLGGADAALSADPSSLGDRAKNTALGAGIGGAAGGFLGRVIQGGTTAARAAMATNPADNYLARQAARALSASKLYPAAMAQGTASGATKPVQAFLAEPDIAARVAALQGLEQFKQTPAESPEMLHALYQSLTDESHAIQKGLAAPDPSKPNTGRFREGNVRALKDKLLGAVGQGGPGQPAMMPAYETAVQDFAKQSGEIDAMGRGMTASQSAAKSTRPTFKNLQSQQPKTPETFAQWANKASDSQKQAASEGILGDVKNAFHEPSKTFAPFRRATAKAPDLLRAVGDNRVADFLQQLGIAGVNGAVKP